MSPDTESETQQNHYEVDSFGFVILSPNHHIDIVQQSRSGFPTVTILVDAINDDVISSAYNRTPLRHFDTATSPRVDPNIATARTHSVPTGGISFETFRQDRAGAPARATLAEVWHNPASIRNLCLGKLADCCLAVFRIKRPPISYIALHFGWISSGSFGEYVDLFGRERGGQGEPDKEGEDVKGEHSDKSDDQTIIFIVVS